MNGSKFVAPLALVLSLGAIAVTGASLNSAGASADAATAPLQTKLQEARDDASRTSERVDQLAQQLVVANDKITRLQRQSGQDEIVRTCALELGQIVDMGMEVSYGWAEPQMSLSQPCSDWLYDDEDEETHP